MVFGALLGSVFYVSQFSSLYSDGSEATSVLKFLIVRQIRSDASSQQ